MGHCASQRGDLGLELRDLAQQAAQCLVLSSLRGLLVLTDEQGGQCGDDQASRKKPPTTRAKNEIAPGVVVGDAPRNPTVVISDSDHQMPRGNDVTMSVSTAATAPPAKMTSTPEAINDGTTHLRRITNTGSFSRRNQELRQ
jgi:hypothetical protein